MNKIFTKKIIAPVTTKTKEEVDNTNELSSGPGNDVINNILNYSKALSIRKSKNVEYFEMVLN
jgi:hypothetical protein